MPKTATPKQTKLLSQNYPTGSPEMDGSHITVS